jgi:hypothetical protein
MVCRPTFTEDRHAAGFTITEFLVALAIAVVLLTGVVAFGLFSSESFAATLNYVDLSNSSKSALERVTRDIRGTRRLKTYDAQDVTFEDVDGADLRWRYDPTAKTLSRTKNGTTETVLTGCESVQFLIFQRTPMAGNYGNYPTADATTCKVVQVQWKCSRLLTGSRSNSESVRSAKVVMRN